jgi:uncharacterized protein involved in type VI secretion and phage assembly
MDTTVEQILARVAERQRTTFYGKYRGIVRDIDDSDGLGRIRAEVPAVLGDTVSQWAMPCLPFAGPKHGMLYLPEVGDGVWIEFEAGSLNSPIWSGCWWGDDQRPEPSGPQQRLIATSAGHQVLIDEEADEISLVHPGGAKLVLGKDSVTLSIGDAKIEMASGEVKINGTVAKFTAAGASLVDDAFKVGG